MAGTIVASTLSDGTNSTSTTNCIQGSAKAWANFNGNNGTVRSSFNISSITYNGTGDYTVNFTTAMPNANYSIVGTAGAYLPSDAVRVFGTYFNGTYTTTQCRVIVVLNSGGGNNRDIVNFSVFSS
jgi:hypothetical protein